MNFSAVQSLRVWAIASMAGLLVIFMLGFFLLRSNFRQVEAIHNQIDYVRYAQLQAQQIEISIERLNTNPASSPEIVSALTKQDQHLKLIKNGGTVSGTEVDIPALQRLPSITYTKLLENWNSYKAVITMNAIQDSIINVDPRVMTSAQSMLVIEWYNRLIDDLEDMLSDSQNATVWTSVTFVIITIAALATIIFYFIREVLRPLRMIGDNTEKFIHTRNLRNNEIGKLADKINEVIEKFRDASDFVKSIGEGRLDTDYKSELDHNYTPGQNQLADSLIEMQRKLRELNQEDLRRKWANEGLAKFVDILRSSDNDIRILGDKIISNLVQYTKSNQGGLYILNDEDPDNKFLELISLHAFNIKKFETQRLKLGEGLLGQAFLERDTTYLTEIPTDYVRITSGLGDSAPKAVLIVPLKLDQDVHGLVELASFNEFKPHEIDFVERLGETIAATLASVKAAQNNQRLLEESKVAAQAMHSQEEEMRQNMEELTATQEEMQRILKESQHRETYLSNLMNATKDAFVAIDRDYRVVIRNNAPLFAQFAKDGIRYEPGFNVLSLFNKEEVSRHREMYDKAFAGESLEVSKTYYGTNYDITYSPIMSDAGEVIGASIFAHDLSERETLEELIRGLRSSLDEVQHGHKPDAIIDEMTNTLKFNLEALRITQEELKNKLGRD